MEYYVVVDHFRKTRFLIRRWSFCKKFILKMTIIFILEIWFVLLMLVLQMSVLLMFVLEWRFLLLFWFRKYIILLIMFFLMKVVVLLLFLLQWPVLLLMVLFLNKFPIGASFLVPMLKFFAIGVGFLLSNFMLMMNFGMKCFKMLTFLNT